MGIAKTGTTNAPACSASRLESEQKFPSKQRFSVPANAGFSHGTKQDPSSADGKLVQKNTLLFKKPLK